jgi:hypothetical protein
MCYDAPMTLPFVVADDDFIEHLHEMGYGDYIDMAELDLEWNIWAIENLE